VAWTTNPYCVLADVHSVIGLQSTQDDAWITNTLIPEAQAYLDREIGYCFQTDGTPQAPATRTYSGNNHGQLLIDDCLSIVGPTGGVFEMVYNVILGSNGIWQTQNVQTIDITADVGLGPDWALNNYQPGYLLYRLSGDLFVRGKNNYQVNGVFGQPSIPPQISRACARLAAHYYLMRSTGYADVLLESGGVKQVFHKPVPNDVLEIIEDFQRRIFLSR
jgi:hypothetical protein